MYEALLLRVPHGVEFTLTPNGTDRFVKSSFDKRTKIYTLFCVSHPSLIVMIKHDTKVFLHV